MKRNPLFSALSENYLFHEVKLTVQKFRKNNPEIELILLGIGDTTEPLVETVVKGLVDTSTALGTAQGYKGYGPEQGISQLRSALYQTLYPTIDSISSDDIFISDGAKCDIGRLQMLFGSSCPIAIQEPSYPAYLDSSLLMHTIKPIPIPSLSREKGQIELDLEFLPNNTVVFLCSPNNPTGTVFSYEELQNAVKVAQKKGLLLIFDVAYRDYAGENTVKTIYEIPGAEEVAIEIGSFSKSAGFSGLRLGWTIIPKQVRYDDGKSIQADFLRMSTTIFNGASYISQMAGVFALSEDGRKETLQHVAQYKKNTEELKKKLIEQGAHVYGGIHAPYLWCKTRFTNSWDAFHYFLNTGHIVTTPGIGFGISGEGFLRISGFGRAEMIEKAKQRIHFLELA